MSARARVVPPLAMERIIADLQALQRDLPSMPSDA